MHGLSRHGPANGLGGGRSSSPDAWMLSSSKRDSQAQSIAELLEANDAVSCRGPGDSTTGRTGFGDGMYVIVELLAAAEGIIE